MRPSDPFSHALAADELRGQRGFSLIEAVVAIVIAVIAVLGLAYSFGLGRGFIGRHEVARVALASAQRRLDSLAVLTAAQLVPGTADSVAFVVHGRTLGWESWRVEWVDERIDSLGGSDLDGNPNDLKRATVRVRWTQGAEISLSRLFPGN
jgi:prepilin-type N-terminal cleavage/methylation domain-containing protein